MKVVVIQDIIDVVCKFYDVTEPQLKSHDRHQSINHARMVACYLIRQLVGCSLAEIGHIFDRDHTTILHAVRTAEAKDCLDDLGFPTDTRIQIDELRKRIDEASKEFTDAEATESSRSAFEKMMKSIDSNLNLNKLPSGRYSSATVRARFDDWAAGWSAANRSVGPREVA